VKAFIQELQYAHWLMVAGVFLVMVGFVGFAFRKNKEGNPALPR
jgi:LPXTG-motif cell wall-anchored protein